MKKTLLWLLFGGVLAYPIEGIWRIPSGGLVSIYMLPVYGLCFWLVGSMNQHRTFYRLSMRLQAFIGAIIVLAVEFVSGCILNVYLGLDIWDYSHLPLNVCGQICALYGVLWFFLVPFAVWLEDKLNHIWERSNGRTSDYDYTLIEAYAELFKI